MVIPLLMLIIAGMIRCSLTLHDRVKDASSSQLEHVQKLMDDRLLTTEDQLRILSVISADSSHIDDIAGDTGMSTARVLAQLTLLEIRGYVRREAGRRFSLNV